MFSELLFGLTAETHLKIVFFLFFFFTRSEVICLVCPVFGFFLQQGLILVFEQCLKGYNVTYGQNSFSPGGSVEETDLGGAEAHL